MPTKNSILCTGIAAMVAIAGCMHDDDRSTAPTTTTRSEPVRESSPNEVTEAERPLDGDRQSALERETVVGGHDGAETQGDANRVPTAQDQSASTSDVEITRRIRQACIDDGSLSTMARNVTIVTNGGVVTLRGDVATSAERTAVERHAQAAPGVTRVNNLLAVDR